MKNLPITVEALRPVAGVKTIVCNNSDYMVVWDLDEDWDQAAKTMRCTWPDGTYQDVVFTGAEAALPPCPAPGRVRIGLYAGNIHTTRPAELVAFPSILSDGGTPAAPGDDVYAQLLALLEGDKVKGEKGDTGTTFTPSVSPNGTLSWTNDGGKENPESINIKGADGAKGADGKKGEDGESITVESVTESTEDGGSNVVIFSDGKSITIKNGSKGGTGPQGPAGSDATVPIATSTVPGKVAPSAEDFTVSETGALALGVHIKTVSALPKDPDPDTLYLIPEGAEP